MNETPESSCHLTEFVRLLTDHQAAIRGYIRVLIPNEFDIRDVLQNTNLFLWEERDTFVAGSNFKAWAFAVARFRAMEHIKKLKQQNRLVFDSQLIELLDADSHEPWSDSMEREFNALEHCLQLLSTKDRALIDARYASRTPLAEYAARDGRSEASLRVILCRLRGILRGCIDKQLHFEEGRT